MKTVAVLCCIALLTACSPMQELSTPEITPPQLLIQHPLPVIPNSINTSNLALQITIYVDEKGMVRDAYFNQGSGDNDWDARALNVIKQWKYSPAKVEGKPVRLWVRQTAFIQLAEPVYISLATILCRTPEEAESVYVALKEGEDFASVAQQFSNRYKELKTSMTEHVDVYSYPKHIQQILLKLEQNSFSNPVRYGEHYVIFKKL